MYFPTYCTFAGILERPIHFPGIPAFTIAAAGNKGMVEAEKTSSAKIVPDVQEEPIFQKIHVAATPPPSRQVVSTTLKIQLPKVKNYLTAAGNDFLRKPLRRRQRSKREAKWRPSDLLSGLFGGSTKRARRRPPRPVPRPLALTSNGDKER